MAKLLPLRGALKPYAWGLSARDSLAASLHVANGGTVDDPDAPAAELWLGTHPSGPSMVGQRALREVLGGDVEFLLKVLSVARPLSIQAHPDKERAARLHMEKPEHYKDDNHKPEMAVALTPFEGMCGFRPLGEIRQALQSLPVLRELTGGTLPASGDGLRETFGALMRAGPADVDKALREASEMVQSRDGEDDKLFLRLRKYYADDAGCFCAYFLNHVKLDVGEALFMAANEPHAYLAGQCMEVMACSDNVVRAGLTPKFRDVDTLIDMLTYRAGSPALIKGEKGDGGLVYRTPVPEFQLVKYQVDKGDTVLLPPHDGHGILLVVQGEGDVVLVTTEEKTRTRAEKGFAACLVDGTQVEIEAGEHGIVLFRASTNQMAPTA